MAEDSDQNGEPPVVVANAWAKATMWMVIVLVVVAGGVFVLKSCLEAPRHLIDKTGKVIEKAGHALATVASAFNRGTITTTFLSYATTISNQHYLQFATLRQTEIFTRTDESSTAFGYVPLPDIVVEARAPVEFTYYLDLNAKWQFVLKDNVIYVLAPPIKFNKPAVDASQITYEIRKGSLLRDAAAAQENLKKSITFLTQVRARENIALVRENGRKQTAEFVEKWLSKSFADGKSYPVKVYFPGETHDFGIPNAPLP